MREISEDIYCFKSFREKLKERYKEHVKFVTATGIKKSEVICFKNVADFTIKTFKQEGETREGILRAAAKIIKEDIRSMDCTVDEYPSNMSSDRLT